MRNTAKSPAKDSHRRCFSKFPSKTNISSKGEKRGRVYLLCGVSFSKSNGRLYTVLLRGSRLLIIHDAPTTLRQTHNGHISTHQSQPQKNHDLKCNNQKATHPTDFSTNRIFSYLNSTMCGPTSTPYVSATQKNSYKEN